MKKNNLPQNLEENKQKGGLKIGFQRNCCLGGNDEGDRVAIDDEIRGLAIICREGHRAHDFTICMLAAGCWLLLATH